MLKFIIRISSLLSVYVKQTDKQSVSMTEINGVTIGFYFLY